MNSRELVLDLFNEALLSVSPAALIKNSITLTGDKLSIEGRVYRLNDYRSVHVFGSGKASFKMAQAVEKILGRWITSGFVVSNYSDIRAGNISFFESSHPVPTEKSIEAADRLISCLDSLTEDDFFIYLLSGGSSAMIEKPVKPLTLYEFQAVTRLLLSESVPIEEINIVRKHLSCVKGGRLALKTGAKGVVLAVSDVIGDDLEAIGSGPLFCDRSTYGDAYGILTKYFLFERLPESARTIIERGLKGEADETPKSPNPRIDHYIIGSNGRLLAGAAEKARSKNIRCHIMTSRLKGEARDVAKAIVSVGNEILNNRRPFEPPVCLLFGGETTVTLRGQGKGGRNQEMCLSALREIRDTDGVVFLSAGTDGIDGNSDAAGAVADSITYEKAARLNLSIDDYLADNDSYHFFKRTDDLIMTGPTGTNVMDIVILYIGSNKHDNNQVFNGFTRSR